MYRVNHKRNQGPRHAGPRPALLLAAAAVISAGTPAVYAGPDPYTKADETWITISGTVELVERDRFALDYGDGTITVEMDDGDRDADGYRLLSGDRITVSGRIDDDFFEKTTIEAGSVFVENLNTTFFASAEDETYPEILDSAWAPPIEVGRTTIRGTVTWVAPDEDQFMVDTGKKSVRVSVDAMAHNPLDNNGYQQIGVGDRVRVIGQVDVSLFEGRSFDAETIVKLYDSKVS